MKLLGRLMLASILSMTFAGIAAATPVTYEITDIQQTGTGNAALGVTSLASSTAGTGDIIVMGGQIASGSGSGAAYVTNIAVAAISQEVDVTRTNYDITTISSVAGDVTAAGVAGNTTCAGSGAGLLCVGLAVGPNLPFTWPVADDGFGLPETATIANFMGSDTSFSFDVLVFSNIDLGANGTVEVTETWHFASSSVPEPGSFVLLASGMMGLAVIGRRRRA
jgi:hypothetical protein